jgi:hypothetical protein
MGKKRQREQELVENYEKYVATSTSDQLLQNQENDDLFSIDRVGSKNSRKRIQKSEILKVKNDSIVSKVENKLIRKKINERNSKKKSQNLKKGQEIVDLWQEEERMEEVGEKETKVKSKKLKDKKPALRIPLPGISYNPSHVDHQDAVAEVLTDLTSSLVS